jgi:hypothetical protein
MFLRIVRLAMVLSILAVAIVTLLAARAYVLPKQAEADVRRVVERTLGMIGPDATYEIASVQQGLSDEKYAEIWCARIKYVGLSEYDSETWTHVVAVKFTNWTENPKYTVAFVQKAIFTTVGCSVN